MLYTAHIRSDGTEQTVRTHLLNVSRLAGEYLEPCQMSTVGRLVGVLHDAGKLTAEFNGYIHQLIKAARGSIDHSYAGARLLYALYDTASPTERTAALTMAHTIVSHHGLHDWLDGDGRDYFSARISRSEGFDEVESAINDTVSEAELKELASEALGEWQTCTEAISKISADKTELAFGLGMLERLIQSALIDADRTDTADFMSGIETPDPPDRAELWKKMQGKLEGELAAFENRTDSISLRRRSISDRCEQFARHRIGACKLIVPTGGGKTLASLRAAITQCRCFGKDRIFYIAPFMSILEQNSDVIGRIAGEGSFLEHHSDMLASIEDENELNEYLLRAERWDSPVISTTMVQFFNTLFSAQTSSVRRMHRLANSVIIIDEVQSVPLKCSDLFCLAVNFLTRVCRTSVILCSATQPTFERKEKYRLLLDDQPDMISDYEEDFQAFRRTRVIPPESGSDFDSGDAACFCCERFRENGDLLVITNTKAQARRLYELIKEELGSEAAVMHLSANMCPAHRRQRIEELRGMLKEHKPVVCVTTQLIEAGVDISFRCVVRSLAGLDNAAQAAGRCNRSGEYGRLCPVYLIKLKDEALGRLDEIKTAREQTENITKYMPGADLLSVDVQNEFFSRMFKEFSERLSYPVKDGDTDTTLLDLLSLDKERWQLCKKADKFTSQAFRTAGTLFEVIDKNTESVIVPYDDAAEELIGGLNSDKSPAEMRELLRRAQKYSVSVYSGSSPGQAVYTTLSGAKVLRNQYYSREFGLDLNGSEHELLCY